MSLATSRLTGNPIRESGPTVLAVGIFDGLHLGHRAILERAVARARAVGGRNVVVSFDPHPDVVLKPGRFAYVAPLTPLTEKRARLQAMGVDELRVIPFTRELSALEPEAFCTEHLVWPYRPIALVVGEDFALGPGALRHGRAPAPNRRGHGLRGRGGPALRSRRRAREQHANPRRVVGGPRRRRRAPAWVGATVSPAAW